MSENQEFDIHDPLTRVAIVDTMKALVALPAGVTATEFLALIRPLQEQHGFKAVIYCVVAALLAQKGVIKAAETHIESALAALATFKEPR